METHANHSYFLHSRSQDLVSCCGSLANIAPRLTIVLPFDELQYSPCAGVSAGGVCAQDEETAISVGVVSIHRTPVLDTEDRGTDTLTEHTTQHEGLQLNCQKSAPHAYILWGTSIVTNVTPCFYYTVCQFGHL